MGSFVSWFQIEQLFVLSLRHTVLWLNFQNFHIFSCWFQIISYKNYCWKGSKQEGVWKKLWFPLSFSIWRAPLGVEDIDNFSCSEFYFHSSLKSPPVSNKTEQWVLYFENSFPIQCKYRGRLVRGILTILTSRRKNYEFSGMLSPSGSEDAQRSWNLRILKSKVTF